MLPLEGITVISIEQAVAAQIPGTLVHEVVRERARTSGMLRLAHPSGVMDLSASVHQEGESWNVEKASAARTARRLMEGDIYIPEYVPAMRNAFMER